MPRHVASMAWAEVCYESGNLFSVGLTTVASTRSLSSWLGRQSWFLVQWSKDTEQGSPSAPKTALMSLRVDGYHEWPQELPWTLRQHPAHSPSVHELLWSKQDSHQEL